MLDGVVARGEKTSITVGLYKRMYKSCLCFYVQAGRYLLQRTILRNPPLPVDPIAGVLLRTLYKNIKNGCQFCSLMMVVVPIEPGQPADLRSTYTETKQSVRSVTRHEKRTLLAWLTDATNNAAGSRLCIIPVQQDQSCTSPLTLQMLGSILDRTTGSSSLESRVSLSICPYFLTPKSKTLYFLTNFLFTSLLHNYRTIDV